MVLALACVVFLGSESLGTRDYFLLSQISDFSFRLLLRWRYSTPPPHGDLNTDSVAPIVFLITRQGPSKTPISNRTSIVARLFVALGTGLPSRCLERVRYICLSRGRRIVTVVHATVFGVLAAFLISDTEVPRLRESALCPPKWQPSLKGNDT
jgi:hypothetical protein